MGWRFVGRRLVLLAASLLVASFVIFAALYLAPGTPLVALSGGRPLPPGSAQVLEQRYHLNESFLAQYWYWLDNALHGNLGVSITLRENVSALIAARIWTTAGLVLYASVIIVVLGIGLGVVSGAPVRAARHRRAGGDCGLGCHPSVRRRDRADHGVRGEARLVPGARERHQLPGRRQAFHLPAIALAAASLAIVARVTRAAVRAEGDREHVQTAVSRGIPAHRVIQRHILRNAASAMGPGRAAVQDQLQPPSLSQGTLLASRVCVPGTRGARFQQQPATIGMASIVEDGDLVTVPGEGVKDLVECGVGQKLESTKAIALGFLEDYLKPSEFLGQIPEVASALLFIRECQNDDRQLVHGHESPRGMLCNRIGPHAIFRRATDTVALAAYRRPVVKALENGLIRLSSRQGLSAGFDSSSPMDGSFRAQETHKSAIQARTRMYLRAASGWAVPAASRAQGRVAGVKQQVRLLKTASRV